MAKAKNKLTAGSVRTLKVHETVTSRSSSVMRYKFYVSRYPEIRLIGRWLETWGFRAGQHIEVVQEQNKLTIRPAWFEDKS